MAFREVNEHKFPHKGSRQKCPRELGDLRLAVILMKLIPMTVKGGPTCGGFVCKEFTRRKDVTRQLLPQLLLGYHLGIESYLAAFFALSLPLGQTIVDEFPMLCFHVTMETPISESSLVLGFAIMLTLDKLSFHNSSWIEPLRTRTRQ